MISVALSVCVVIAVAAAFAVYRFNFWRKEALKMVSGGYLPPPPTMAGNLFLRMLGRIFCFLFVGKVKVKGRENARADRDEHLLVVGNHQFQLDVATMSRVIPGKYRHLGKASEMKNPIRGFLAVFTGHFAARVEGGKSTGGSQEVIDACAGALASSHLLLFPQGKLVYDNVLRPEDFRTGAVRIAQQCAASSRTRVSFLPVAIHYDENPEHASWLYSVMKLVGFKTFRKFPDSVKTRTFYGATVVVGKRIPLCELPEDPREAIEAIRRQIAVLLAEAQKG